MVKQTFRVPDMHCPSCVMRIEGLEDELPGVTSVRASYQKQQVEVEFDAGRLTVEQIAAAIVRLGYTISG